MNAKYRIYRIWVFGRRLVSREDAYVDNLKLYRIEIADKFKVSTEFIKFQYDHLDEKWDDLKHPIPLEK